jgi:REP element-mobilizing transposase RayT
LNSKRPTGEQKTAQGFSPGNDTHKEIALKGRPKWHCLQRIYILFYAMAQSLSHLIVHAVFSTKDRRPLLRSEEIRSETYSYLAGIWKNLQCHPIKIGGADDHVHILSSLSKNIAFAEMIGRVKGSSSKRLSEKGVLGFAWQNGIRGFLSQRVERRGRYRLHFRSGRASPQIFVSGRAS